jgi:hypothetical protein
MSLLFHNDGGVNCFIFNKASYFWRLHSTDVDVHQLNGSLIQASGFGIVVILSPCQKAIMALWPCYLYETAPQYTFSSKALKHYLQLSYILTEHTVRISIQLSDDIQVTFLSCPQHFNVSCLGYFSADVVHPSSPTLSRTPPSLPLPSLWILWSVSPRFQNSRVRFYISGSATVVMRLLMKCVTIRHS